jgi:hypothetical protein
VASSACVLRWRAPRRTDPVQFPTKFEMAVNRKNASALGLQVPLTILLRADEIIE